MHRHKTILRIKKKSKFTVMSNYALEDKLLTPAALGVLVYLLSKPDDWVVYNGEVQRRFGIGRKKFDRIMGELKQAGYITRQTRRNRNGTFYTETIVYEVPLPLFGTAAYPADVPLPDSGSTGNGAAGSGLSGSGKGASLPKTNPAKTEAPSAERSIPERVTAPAPNDDASHKKSAVEIYTKATRIRPEKIQPVVLDWLNELEENLCLQPDALLQAIKEVDRNKPEVSIFNVRDLDDVYRHYLRDLDQPMYLLAYEPAVCFRWHPPEADNHTDQPRLAGIYLGDRDVPEIQWRAEELSPQAMKLAERRAINYPTEMIAQLVDSILKQKWAAGTETG